MAHPTPLTNDEAVRRLRLFNEKAEKLARSSFIEKVFRSDHGFSFSFGEGKPFRAEKRGADEEATDAFTLTLRFFFQPRDGISIEQIGKLYETLPVSDELKRYARTGLEWLEDALNEPSPLVYIDRRLSVGEVLEVFMYGDLAHANDDKRPVVERFTAWPEMRKITEHFYEDAVARVYRIIVGYKELNVRAIAELANSANGQATGRLAGRD